MSEAKNSKNNTGELVLTCIVGFVNKNKVYIGGDSAGIANLDVRTRSDTKVFRNEEFLFGCCGSFRMISLLKYDFVPPDNEYDIDDLEFCSTKVVNSIRTCFRDGGSMKVQDSVEGSQGSFLMGYRGQLYHVDEDFQVGTFYEPYAAVGCGSSYALGVMYALKNAAPKRRIQEALSAAEKFCVGVRSPFVIMSI